MESMLSPAGTHAKFLDDFKVEADTMSAAVNLWQGFRDDSEAVRDDDLNQTTAQIKKALAEYKAWADIVPDVQLEEKEFMKFIRNGKLASAKEHNCPTTSRRQRSASTRLWGSGTTT